MFRTNENKKKGGSESQFPGKLHDMMAYVEQGGLESVISWVLNGRAFILHNPEKLVEILPKFFAQTMYRSFRRQLNMWHFERILDGPNRGAFLHPYFVRGNKSLCSDMSRHVFLQPQATDSVDSHVTKQKSSVHIDMKNEAQRSKTNALNWINSLKRTIAQTNTEPDKRQCILRNTTKASSQAESPETTEDFEDGDLVSFAGRKFFFVDSVDDPSPCATTPAADRTTAFSDLHYGRNNLTDFSLADINYPEPTNKVEYLNSDCVSNFILIDYMY
jgi:hypothetical protein